MQRGSLQMWMAPMGIGDHPSQDAGGQGSGGGCAIRLDIGPLRARAENR